MKLLLIVESKDTTGQIRDVLECIKDVEEASLYLASQDDEWTKLPPIFVEAVIKVDIKRHRFKNLQ